MSKFEKVSRFNNIDINLPVRKTKYSAGYDFEVAEDIEIQQYKELIDKIGNYYYGHDKQVYTLDEISKITKSLKAKPALVPTGVKCKLEPDEYLQLSVRSSCPLKYWLILANGIGIIDADYYNNPDNEGEIFFQIINLSPMTILLKKGDIIGQGVILKYDLTDDDLVEKLRIGGFGSTDN